MKERDDRDSTRAESPLSQAPDAVYLDSTALGIEQVIESILKIVRVALNKRKGIYQLNDLLVMKFGGTSVGSAERMRVVGGADRRGTEEAPGGDRGLGDVEGHGSAARHDAPRRGRAIARPGDATWRDFASATTRRAGSCCRPTEQGAVAGESARVIDEFERIAERHG